jgi:hypothetical protein
MGGELDSVITREGIRTREQRNQRLIKSFIAVEYITQMGYPGLERPYS